MAGRSVWLGVKRGVRFRCPECGGGRLFCKYLKVQSPCERCGHANAQYPADDAAPYFTIFLVGHLVVAPMLLLSFIWRSNLWLVLLTTLPILAGVTLVALPMVKGGAIGLMWALGLKRRDAPAAQAS